MRKVTLFLALFLLLPDFISAKPPEWNITRSTHFIIYYKNAPDKFLDLLIDKAEGYYNEIADNLGFKRYKYWLWDNRAKIYIHDDAQGYQAATGGPAWSYGNATPRDKIIHSFPSDRLFFDTILPHELSHIIFREFVGFDNTTIPLWLDEGVACYQEERRRPSAKKIVQQAIDEGKYIPLENLSTFNLMAIKDEETVKTFYAEAITVVDFLIKEFGDYRFVTFCRKLRDKGSFQEALISSYRFKDIQALDKAWQSYIFSN